MTDSWSRIWLQLTLRSFGAPMDWFFFDRSCVPCATWLVLRWHTWWLEAKCLATYVLICGYFRTSAASILASCRSNFNSSGHNSTLRPIHATSNARETKVNSRRTSASSQHAVKTLACNLSPSCNATTFTTWPHMFCPSGKFRIDPRLRFVP